MNATCVTACALQAANENACFTLHFRYTAEALSGHHLKRGPVPSAAATTSQRCGTSRPPEAGVAARRSAA